MVLFAAEVHHAAAEVFHSAAEAARCAREVVQCSAEVEAFAAEVETRNDDLHHATRDVHHGRAVAATLRRRPAPSHAESGITHTRSCTTSRPSRTVRIADLQRILEHLHGR